MDQLGNVHAAGGTTDQLRNVHATNRNANRSESGPGASGNEVPTRELKRHATHIYRGCGQIKWMYEFQMNIEPIDTKVM